MLEEKRNGTVLKQFQLIGMTKNRSNPLGAKNNDSLSEKLAIVKFYTMEYRKCGNSNSKNDSRPCMGASAILKSVDFRAFAVNVKTIAPIQKLYQSGHAIWWGEAPRIVSTFGVGSSASNLEQLTSGATWLDGHRLNGSDSQDTVMEWIREKYFIISQI